jgi:hypothetical protein
MAASSTNRVRTAALAESIATELARAAHYLDGQGQAATAEALLRQAHHNRILALQLRAEAGAEQCLRTVGQAGSDSRFVS